MSRILATVKVLHSRFLRGVWYVNNNFKTNGKYQQLREKGQGIMVILRITGEELEETFPGTEKRIGRRFQRYSIGRKRGRISKNSRNNDHSTTSRIALNFIKIILIDILVSLWRTYG